MFKRVWNKNRRGRKVNSSGFFTGAFIGFEVLEDRRLMSASHGLTGGGIYGGDCAGDQGQGGAGQQVSQVAFSLIPTAAQTELDALATTAGLTDPTSATTVNLGNLNGTETYSVTIKGTGIVATITSDASGNPVTAPTTSTITWATLNGTGTGSDSAAASEIAAIATALDLTAPTDTTNINVVTTSDGTTSYSLQLTPSSDSSSDSDYASRPVNITVFANGDPTGNQSLPFSVIPTSIQNAINNNLPSGATALSTDSTQDVQVQTIDGVTLYSATFTTSGTTTTVTVNEAGTLTSLPTHTTTTFGDLTSAQQTELQTIAAAEGDTATLASDQSVDQLVEANGTTLFSVTIPITETNVNGNSVTHDSTLTIDSNSDVTVLPGQDGIGQRYGGPGGDGGGGGFNPGGPIQPIDGNGNCGGSDSGTGIVNPGGPIQFVSGAGGSDDSGDPTSGSCPTGGSSSGSDSSGSGSSSDSNSGTVSSGAIPVTKGKKSSKKTSKATTKAAKNSAKKSKSDTKKSA